MKNISSKFLILLNFKKYDVGLREAKQINPSLIFLDPAWVLDFITPLFLAKPSE
jgi:hypothetical protein